jgi:hypothetical protein
LTERENRTPPPPLGLSIGRRGQNTQLVIYTMGTDCRDVAVDSKLDKEDMAAGLESTYGSGVVIVTDW